MPSFRLLPAVAGVCLLTGFVHAAEVPRPAPEMAIHLTNGKQILLSEYKGKVVALAFILTSCPHCQKTVGILSGMQNEYAPQGFQAIASAIEDMAAMNVPDFLKRFQPSFPVGFDERQPVLDFLQHPVMFRLLMPQVAFIDRQGVIRAQYSGDDKFFADDQDKHIRDQIEALLKVPAPQKKGPATARKKSS